MTAENIFEGRCSCSKLRYRMNAKPLVVHACHCRQCQRVTGTAFVMNAVVEKNQLEILSGSVANYHFPDTYHTAFFCPECVTYVWSEYKSGTFDDCWFVRVGTLDEPDRLPPDVHIFTESKQPWAPIPSGAPKFDRFYTIKELWSESSLARMEPYWQDK
ncbi:MAG: GFA family protein [Gammaproteobacteria bacterium]|nr:GFA family protein [Gammaproteobacteria bacterium]